MIAAHCRRRLTRVSREGKIGEHNTVERYRGGTTIKIRSICPRVREHCAMPRRIGCLPDLIRNTIHVTASMFTICTRVYMYVYARVYVCKFVVRSINDQCNCVCIMKLRIS